MTNKHFKQYLKTTVNSKTNKVYKLAHNALQIFFKKPVTFRILSPTLSTKICKKSIQCKNLISSRNPVGIKQYSSLVKR